MNSMKKVLPSLLLALILLLAAPFAVMAAEDSDLHGSGPWTSNNGTEFYMPYVEDNTARVYDYADLLTEAGEAALTERILEVQSQKGCDIFILTSNVVPSDLNYETTTSAQYLEQFYMDNGFTDDCLAMIIDMNNRVIYTMGHGKYAADKYVDFHSKVYDDALEYAASGDYYGAILEFIEDVYRLENVWAAAVPTAGSLIVSLILSVFTILGLVGKHSLAQPVHNAKIAVKAKHYRKVASNSVFLGKNVTSHRIVRNTDSGGGGGGFSGGTHSGGGFSGGGGSFSGGGGHF